MSKVESSPQKNGSSTFQKVLDVIEFVGNKFPSPFILFSLLGLAVLIISAIFDGASGTYIGKGGKLVEVKILSLLNADGFRYIITSMVKNFINFPPLGLVVVMMLAMGLAEATGFVSALVRKILGGVPSWAITATIFLIGINGNLASDAAMVFVPAAAAAVYASMGKNPILGMSIAFAATAAGFSANFIPAGTDALIAGITQTAIGNVAATANSPVHPLINYYLMSSSVIVLTVVGTFVAEKVVAPRLEKIEMKKIVEGETEDHRITPEEIKGLKYAGWTALVYIILLMVLMIPESGLLRDPKTHQLLPKSPFLDGIIPILFLLFFSIGTAFGIGKGVIKKESDIPKFLSQGLAGSLSFIVTAFAAAQFVAWFNKANIATVVAIKGAKFLQALDFTGVTLVVSLILLAAFVDLFVISGSAKWLVLAPVFVPMFGLLGYEPALTQAAYRIGESSVNSVTPLNYYVPVMLGIMAKYIKDDKIGMGTLMATQVPYALGFLVSWTLWLLLFMALNIPLGPGANIFIK